MSNKLPGEMLQSNLTRSGTNLTFDNDLLHLDVAARRVGIGTVTPDQALAVEGSARLDDIVVQGTTLSATAGNITLTPGLSSNVVIDSGTANSLAFFGPANEVQGSALLYFDGASLVVDTTTTIADTTFTSGQILSDQALQITTLSGDITLAPGGGGEVVIPNLTVSNLPVNRLLYSDPTGVMRTAAAFAFNDVTSTATLTGTLNVDDVTIENNSISSLSSTPLTISSQNIEINALGGDITIDNAYATGVFYADPLKALSTSASLTFDNTNGILYANNVTTTGVVVAPAFRTNNLEIAGNDIYSMDTGDIVTVYGSATNNVLKTGDTMAGFLTLHADPTNASHAVTKQYVDSLAQAITEIEMGSVIYSQQQPPGYLPANGAVYSRAEYPALRAKIGTVPDGINWTSRASAADNQWHSVCWSPGLSLFCAVSSNGTDNRVMTSPDGITWTSQTTSAANSQWRSVCWSPELSLFCAVSTSFGTGNQVMTSPDGITWTLQSSATDNLWRSVCWSPELSLFCAVSSSGDGSLVMTSPDGITWTSQTSATNNSWYSVCWSPELSLFCAVSSSGTGDRVMTSPDGITWTSRTSAANNSWYSVCWSPALSLFCAVSYNGTGNQVMTSPDGITWTSQTSAEDYQWRSVCWSPELSLFCAVSSSGTGNRVMTSPDGITWTIRTSAVDNQWYSVCWSPELSMFCAVAYTGTGTGDRVMTNAPTYNPTTHFKLPNLPNATDGEARPFIYAGA